MAAGGAHFVAILSSDRLNRQTEGRPQKKKQKRNKPEYITAQQYGTTNGRAGTFVKMAARESARF